MNADEDWLKVDSNQEPIGKANAEVLGFAQIEVLNITAGYVVTQK